MINRFEIINMARERKSVDTDYLVREYLAGASTNKLAGQLGVSRGLVDKRLLAAGVKLRTQSEAESLKWAAKTVEERAAQVAAAHNAVRGMTRTEEDLSRRARSKQATKTLASGLEHFVYSELTARGLQLHQQTAVGPYNCDFTTGTVAVEIFGGAWHWTGLHLARTEKRFRYIMNAGYDILAIAVDRRFPFTPTVADYLAAEIDLLRRHPPAIREYRVIWGAGQASTGGSIQDDHVSIEYPFTNARDARTGKYKRIPR